MTTNCNDTCDAVDKLLLLKTNGYVGLNSIKFVFQYPINYPYSKNIKMAFVIPEIFFHLKHKLPVFR